MSWYSWFTVYKTSLSDTSGNAKVEKELEKLERQRAKLLEAYLEEIISKEDYKSKYADIESKIEEKKKHLAPVEDNEDIKEIERILANLDEELDEFIKTLDVEENKIDFLIEHTKKITVLENKDLVIELDLVAGAIIAGKKFLLYVHDSMPFNYESVCFFSHGEGERLGGSVLYRFLCDQHRGNREPASQGYGEEAEGGSHPVDSSPGKADYPEGL